MLFDTELDDEVTVILVREELELAAEPPPLPIPLVARKLPAADRITLELDALDLEALAAALQRPDGDRPDGDRPDAG